MKEEREDDIAVDLIVGLKGDEKANGFGNLDISDILGDWMALSSSFLFFEISKLPFNELDLLICVIDWILSIY
jgi:hypothetical protein